MTTVEPYRSHELDHYRSTDEAADVHRRTASTSPTTLRNSSVPPAVPSPPPISSRSSPSRRIHAKQSTPLPAAMANEAPNQWLFTDAELNNTPSVLDGLPIAEERCRRAKGINFIIQAGILLKLPQLTLATAAVFFHRFYMRSSMVPEKGGLHQYNIAATSLFLATKTEENCRKTKEIVIAVAKVAQKNASLIIDEQSKEYWRWRDSILLYEELMLEYLTFDVVLQSPYTILYHMLPTIPMEDNKALRNVAWAFLNDSCMTLMCLIMPPKDIAIAAVYFAAKFTGERIPDDEAGTPWWEILGGRADRIIKAVAVMNEFWTENPLRRSENPYEQSPSSFSNEEDLDRTRRPGEVGSSGETPSHASQNGRRQSDGGYNGTPRANGTTVEEPTVNGTKIERQSSSQNNSAIESATPTKPTADIDTSGSSDAQLKAAANDPATHEMTGNSNGVSDLLNSALKSPPKRKELENAEEPEGKRAKVEEGALEVSATTMAEESEEGELEE